MTDEDIVKRLTKRPQIQSVSIVHLMVMVDFKCIFCGKEYSRTYLKAEIENWLKGDYIQKAMPGVSTDDRESLISGICSFCFDSVYKED